MDKKQYNNVIDWTLKHEAQAQSEDSLEVTRAICNELGVALPLGDLAQVAEVLATDDYMGWKACTKEEAQEAANSGIPAIGISNDQIVMLAAEDEEQPVAQAISLLPVCNDSVTGNVEEGVYYAYQHSTIRKPHGEYRTFTCDNPAVCNDGKGNSYCDIYHVDHTYFMENEMNADVHRYIVLPGNANGFAELMGCVGVAVRNDGQYVFGIVGERGPSRSANVLDEFSVKMIKDLGFLTDGANFVDPEDTVTTYIFPETQRPAKEWNAETLNEDVEAIGRMYYY